MVMEIAQLIRKDFSDRTLSGLGGVETGADAAQFILLGSDTVQVCTGVMKFGYGMAKDLCEGLLEFMEGKGFETINESKGLSLPYFTTHAELVRMQLAREADEAAAKERGSMVKNDAEWDGDDFVKQSDALAR
jgi:dihydropyrimidine dehydrogenase (NADP+)/dihydropyrimidine dehydrogenase (NAD+) subunit PreA